MACRKDTKITSRASAPSCIFSADHHSQNVTVQMVGQGFDAEVWAVFHT